MNLLDTVFEWVVATTVRASGVALAILAIQLLLRPWLPAKWRHPLWLPLLLVMVLPIVPALPLHPIPARPAAAASPSGELPATTAGDAASAATIHAVDPAPQERLPLLPALWLAGVVVTLGAGLAGYRRKLAAIRASAVAPAPGLRGEIEAARQAAGLAKTPVVWLSREVESPAVCGLWRPVLLLPAGFPASFTAAEARLILLHEFSHLKRHDLAQNWLLFALQALHWFNPLIWFAFARLRRDRETACDARVLALDAEDRRVEYGHALLKMQELPAAGGLRLGFLGIFENVSGLRARITDISRHRRNHPAWQVAGCGLVAAIALFGSTRAQEVAPETKDAAEEEAGPAREDEAKLSIAQAAINRKLDTLIMPEVNFEDTSLEEAIDFLRLRSTELDAAEPDPSEKGVNFVIRKPRPVDGQPAPKPALLTFGMKNVPLRRILDEAARQSGWRYLIDEFAVTFVPAGEPDPAPPAIPGAAKEGVGKPPMPMIVVKPPTLAHLPGQAVKAAAKIVIPTLTFDGLTLGEAVELLNSEAKKHAGAVKPPLVTLHPKADANLPLKELKLRNVPLENALIYVGDLCRMNIRADDRQIQLYPATLRNP
jgi:beta-lactamase regulating signal transducer with metallopeptidase domain